MLRYRSLLAAMLALPLALPLAAVEADAPRTTEANPADEVVAEGRFRYRARDVDALVLIARRHLGRPFEGDEEQEVREAIVRMLTAREPLRAERERLPPGFTANQRDHLVLDILDYSAEPIPGGASAPADPVATRPQPATAPTSLTTIPTLTLRRMIGDTPWRLSMDLSLLSERDATTAIPLVQDALLTRFHALDADLFTRLSPVDCKTHALKALADLPIQVRKVLVTGLEVTPETP